MGQKTVVEAADVPAYRACEAMGTSTVVVIVTSDIEGLGDQIALERDVLGPARAEGLVDGPRDRTVINDTVIADGQAHSVHCLAGQITESKPLGSGGGSGDSNTTSKNKLLSQLGVN